MAEQTPQVATLRRKHRHALAGGRFAEARRLLQQATALAVAQGQAEPQWGLLRTPTTSQAKG